MMGLLNGLIGNASEVSLEKITEDYEKILTESEKIEHAYKLIRDLFIFTNKRLILIDIQGLTGKKIEYLSIPYRSITHFTIETSGNFDLDAELKIWIIGMSESPIQKKFNRSLNIYELQSILAHYVL